MSIGNLEAALDAVHSTQAPFCHHYRLLSSADRRVRDTTVIQLAAIANVQSQTVRPAGPRASRSRDHPFMRFHHACRQCAGGPRAGGMLAAHACMDSRACMCTITCMCAYSPVACMLTIPWKIWSLGLSAPSDIPDYRAPWEQATAI